uniref:CASP-like protein n=1 Tax=Leersia perrieri TaxID=77586 RepID=A0A0D9VHH8_9ORYZ
MEMEEGAVIQHGETSVSKAPPLPPPGRRSVIVSRLLSVTDIVLRFLAIGGTAASAIAMATTSETLPFSMPFVRFRAEYSDLPSFMFFVVANSVVCGYLVLSLPASVVHVFRPRARCSRVALVFFDTVMLALVTAGASAAAVIVYLAHRGSAKPNWFGICQQLTSFCGRVTGSLVGSFAAAVMLVTLVFLSALALAGRA